MEIAHQWAKEYGEMEYKKKKKPPKPSIVELLTTVDGVNQKGIIAMAVIVEMVIKLFQGIKQEQIWQKLHKNQFKDVPTATCIQCNVIAHRILILLIIKTYCR